jgi:hypothetical protein
MKDPKTAVSAVSSPTPSPVWKQRYEALRQLAVGGRQILESEPLGWVWLLRQGIAGWMRSWSQLTPTAALSSAPMPPPAAATSGWQQQLTQVLADMSLAHLPKESR